MPGYGLTFGPPTSPDRQDQQSAAAQLGPSQRAVQILSLHLPRILGSRAISPSSLLAPGGGGGGAPAGALSPESAVLQSAIKAYQGGGAQPGGLPGGVSSDDIVSQLVHALTAGGGYGGDTGGPSAPTASSVLPSLNVPSPSITIGDFGQPGGPTEKAPIDGPAGGGSINAPTPDQTTVGQATPLGTPAAPLTVDEIKRRFSSPAFRPGYGQF